MYKEVVKHGVTTYSALPYPLPGDYTVTLKELGMECNKLRAKFDDTNSLEDGNNYRKAQVSLDKFVSSLRVAFGFRVSRPLHPVLGERNG